MFLFFDCYSALLAARQLLLFFAHSAWGLVEQVVLRDFLDEWNYLI